MKLLSRSTRPSRPDAHFASLAQPPDLWHQQFCFCNYLHVRLALGLDVVDGELGPGVADEAGVLRQEAGLLEDHPEGRVDLLLGEVAGRAEDDKHVRGVRVLLVVLLDGLQRLAHELHALGVTLLQGEAEPAGFAARHVDAVVVLGRLDLHDEAAGDGTQVVHGAGSVGLDPQLALKFSFLLEKRKKKLREPLIKGIVI